MDESRILIIGANGQLGRALEAKYPAATAVDRDRFDMTDQDMVEAYDWSGVDTIINAAAYTNVDGAETDEGRPQAWKVNAVATGYLSSVATKHSLTLVHVSSDYVFDGTKENHTEDEAVAPLGVYAQTKAAGDIAASITPKHYIMRTHALIGDGHNFVRIMMGLAEKNIEPKVVKDQITRLTFAHTLAEGIGHLLTTQAAYGIYNLSNDGEPTSWADIAQLIFTEIGRSDLKAMPVTTPEYFASKPHAAPRPLKSYFDLAKIKAAGFTPSDWRTELHQYIQAELAKPKEQ